MMAFLQLCYTLWFFFMWYSIVFSVFMGSKASRWRYSIAFFLCWILVGSLAAYLLASAGPCFYDLAFHDTRFSDLMDHLRRSDAALRQISPYLGLQSLRIQDILWSGFVAHKDEFGAGISAMPSMHVTMSCVMALGAYQISKPAGRVMTVFAVMIWIGSIQLGWHYAMDGIVGAAMALAIWQLAGAITARFILREAGGAAPVVPDAEAALVR
jgi:membrane-associated phospholipid phosphatase